nr:hypothetical protein [Candidatus Gracilibacteria bacterium]
MLNTVLYGYDELEKKIQKKFTGNNILDVLISKKDVFTFNEFKGLKNINNFAIFFNQNGIGFSNLNKQSFIKRFYEENQEMYNTLCDLITHLEGKITDNNNQEIIKLLYSAYVIIKNYEGVSNLDLFR